MKWIGVPDNATVLVVTKPLYPAVGDTDDLTDELDHWADTHTNSCKVIDLLDNDEA